MIDPELGELVPSEDGIGWVGKIRTDQGEVEIEIDGDDAPDPWLVAHARELKANPSRLLAQVQACIEEFASRLPVGSEEVRAELTALRLASIVLYWKKGAQSGMLYFDGPDEYRLWRCDYVDGVVRHLGFDD
jgi:hypothetical protein